MMNAKEHHARGIFIGAIILLMLACIFPISPTATPLGVPKNLPEAQVPGKITDPASPPINTEIETPTPTITLTITPTFTHTLTPTNSPTPTYTASPTSTWTSTSSPTNTPLPPMPNFDGILSFGTGGAEDGFCEDWGDSTKCLFYDTPEYDLTTTLPQVESNWITSPSEESRLEVVGRNYPAKLLVFILLYVKIQDPSISTPIPGHPNGNYLLVEKRVGVADLGGLVKLMVPIQLESGKRYLLIASTDPDGKIQLRYGQAEEFRQNRAAPWFIFSIPAVVSSCPGAPTQRMVANQRGYVCTKEDAVKLRNAPKRSGSEITQLASGASFTVVGGPSCADNWSWWNVRLDNGTTGWVSEGGDQTDPYFICPLK
jgi:hypothetical protein